MRLHRRRMFLVVTVLLLGALLAPAAPRALAADEGITVGQWSQRVWESARTGDRGMLDRFVLAIPSPTTGADLERLRGLYARYRENERNSDAGRLAKRTEASAKLAEHAAAGQLSQALVKAVEMQSYSKDLSVVLHDPAVQGLVQQARVQVRQATAEGDILYAQELLFRLRTLYEDTNDLQTYEAYRHQLQEMNRRVSLLATYAPRRLHELSNLQAARFGEEPLKPFNPAVAEEWRERVDGISSAMLWSSLMQAAKEHIESNGWRPLLTGGLNALRTLATTAALAETFPALADPGKVGPWVDYIDSQLTALADRNLDDAQLHRMCRRVLLDELPQRNKQTLALPREVLYHEFGDGAVSALDDFSEIIWPDKVRRFEQSTAGHFGGVGIIIRLDDKRDIQIVKPLEGTPAYYAGVKPEDRIVHVDGQPTNGWTLNEAANRISGRPGTNVTIGLRRSGQEDDVIVQLTRREIKIPSVIGWWKKRLDDQGNPEWDWMIDPVSRIGYVRLAEFSENTADDLRAAWRRMSELNEPAGLILDLRFNPGGLLTSAVEISNLFLTEGLIVRGEDKDQTERWKHRADRGRAEIAQSQVPVVVLINKGSASASEIVAGCLQAHGRALIVGERSFGKGNVQTVHDISREPDAKLKLTTQYYRLPPKPGEFQGRLVHKRPGSTQWGVDPDLRVDMTPDQVVASLELRQSADTIGKPGEAGASPPQRPNVGDLVDKGLDPQLETALLLLQVRALARSEVRQARLN